MLLFTKNTINDLLDKGEATISLMKGGKHKQRHVLKTKIDSSGLKEIHFLKNLQPLEQGPFFIASNKRRDNVEKPLSRVNFDLQINRILKSASHLFAKHIRSHSFRATFITGLLERQIPIEKVQHIIGHVDIGTTDAYRRKYQLKMKFS